MEDENEDEVRVEVGVEVVMDGIILVAIDGHMSLHLQKWTRLEL